MPEPTDAAPTAVLRNRRRQPVELHLPGGVQVLLPGAEATLPADSLALPQLAWLLARGALDLKPRSAVDNAADTPAESTPAMPPEGEAEAGVAPAAAEPEGSLAGETHATRGTRRLSQSNQRKGTTA